MIKEKFFKWFAFIALLFAVFTPPALAQSIDPGFCLAVDQAADTEFLFAVSQIRNIPDAPVVSIGVSETKDIAAFFFSTYEAYIKATLDGAVNMTDIQYLLPPAMALIPAFSGASQVISELKSLTDEQIKTLLLVANDYALGEHAQRAKQVFKAALILIQTYFVFEAASATQ